jgi:hypothetical protein
MLENLCEFCTRMVDFEYDNNFLKSMVSDFFHFVLSVFTVGENQFRENKIPLKTHHKVAKALTVEKKSKMVY